MFDKKDRVKKFLKYMNPLHCNIKFTVEDEHNSSGKWSNLGQIKHKVKKNLKL